MPDDAHFRRLEALYREAPVHARSCPDIEVGDGTARLEATLLASDYHSGGVAHGSVLFKLLDDAAFFAAQSRWTGRLGLTASFSVWFVRPGTEGPVVATGRLVHRTRTLSLADAELADAAGKVLARGRGTYLPAGPPLEA